MTEQAQYEMDPSCSNRFKEYIEERMKMPYFSNARTVRNAVERARMRSAVRLFNQAMQGNGTLTGKDLRIFTADDITSAEELRARGKDAITE